MENSNQHVSEFTKIVIFLSAAFAIALIGIEIVIVRAKWISDHIETVEGDDLIISDVSWYLDPPRSDNSSNVAVYYYFDVTNPNRSAVAYVPTAEIEFYNEDGDLVDNDKLRVTYILPRETVRYFGVTHIIERPPLESVKLEVSFDSTRFTRLKHVRTPIGYDEIELSHIDTDIDNGDVEVSGDITNNSDYTLDSATIAIVYKYKGEIIYVDRYSVSNIHSGETKEFSTKVFRDIPEFDEVECFVAAW